MVLTDQNGHKMSDTLILNASGQPMSHFPLSVVPATKALRLVYQGKVSVLKEYDDWVIRSAKLEINVPSIIMMNKQVKWVKEIKYNRGNIYLRDDFTCQLQYTSYCRSVHGKVKFTDLTLDHVIPQSHGGKTNWKNICTSCKACNSAKGNDASIVPKRPPHKPTHYEILAKRRTLPIYIRDEGWRYYIDWPEELVKLVPNHSHKLVEPDGTDE